MTSNKSIFKLNLKGQNEYNFSLAIFKLLGIAKNDTDLLKLQFLFAPVLTGLHTRLEYASKAKASEIEMVDFARYGQLLIDSIANAIAGRINTNTNIVLNTRATEYDQEEGWMSSIISTDVLNPETNEWMYSTIDVNNNEYPLITSFEYSHPASSDTRKRHYKKVTDVLTGKTNFLVTNNHGIMIMIANLTNMVEAYVRTQLKGFFKEDTFNKRNDFIVDRMYTALFTLGEALNSSSFNVVFYTNHDKNLYKNMLATFMTSTKTLVKKMKQQMRDFLKANLNNEDAKNVAASVMKKLQKPSVTKQGVTEVKAFEQLKELMKD